MNKKKVLVLLFSVIAVLSCAILILLPKLSDTLSKQPSNQSIKMTTVERPLTVIEWGYVGDSEIFLVNLYNPYNETAYNITVVSYFYDTYSRLTPDTDCIIEPHTNITLQWNTAGLHPHLQPINPSVDGQPISAFFNVTTGIQSSPVQVSIQFVNVSNPTSINFNCAVYSENYTYYPISTIPLNGAITFIATTNAINPVYQWIVNGTPLSGANSVCTFLGANSVCTFIPSQTGVCLIEVKVTDTFGIATVSNVECFYVTSEETLSVSISANSTTLHINEPLTITSTISSSLNLSELSPFYNWDAYDFSGAGENSTLTNTPNLVYSSTQLGSHRIFLNLEIVLARINGTESDAYVYSNSIWVEVVP